MGGGGPGKAAALLASGVDPLGGAEASAATVAEGAGGGGEAASVDGPTTPSPASDGCPPLDPVVGGSTGTAAATVPELGPAAPEAAPLTPPLAAPLSKTGRPDDASLQPQLPMAV